MTEINNLKALVQQDLLSKHTSASENNEAAASISSSSATSRPDTVSLTDTGEKIQTLQQIISETPEVDQARVESLRAAIESGSYNVDSAQVAQNLLSFEGLLN